MPNQKINCKKFVNYFFRISWAYLASQDGTKIYCYGPFNAIKGDTTLFFVMTLTGIYTPSSSSLFEPIESKSCGQKIPFVLAVPSLPQPHARHPDMAFQLPTNIVQNSPQLSSQQCTFVHSVNIQVNIPHGWKLSLPQHNVRFHKSQPGFLAGNSDNGNIKCGLGQGKTMIIGQSQSLKLQESSVSSCLGGGGITIMCKFNIIYHASKVSISIKYF